ncbi:MAG TPA: DUF3168 domain-containing protein [Caulobacterales bacterium]|nr:DUF3168 domain-containing protein [Caulobacterales bacterium]
MIDPGPALQKAIVAALRAGPELIEQFRGATPRVYDSIPNPAVFPYIQVGEDQTLNDGEDDGECLAGSEVFCTIHVWSRAVGKVEAKLICGAIREALSATLAVEGQRVVVSQFRDVRILTDPDGLTAHGVYTHRFLLEPA